MFPKISVNRVEINLDSSISNHVSIIDNSHQNMINLIRTSKHRSINTHSNMYVDTRFVVLPRSKVTDFGFKSYRNIELKTEVNLT